MQQLFCTQLLHHVCNRCGFCVQACGQRIGSDHVAIRLKVKDCLQVVLFTDGIIQSRLILNLVKSKKHLPLYETALPSDLLYFAGNPRYGQSGFYGLLCALSWMQVEKTG